jgi:drug/metabolite transporter (DMT)-like permease
MISKTDNSYTIALAIAITSALSVIVRKYLLNKGVQWKPMMAVNAFFFFFFGCFFTYYYREDIIPEIKHFDWKIFAILGITILFSTFIVGILNYLLLLQNDVYIVSGLTLTAPIFTVILAKLLLNEDVSCKGVLGVLIMLVGSWIIIQAKQESDIKKN